MATACSVEFVVLKPVRRSELTQCLSLGQPEVHRGAPSSMSNVLQILTHTKGSLQLMRMFWRNHIGPNGMGMLPSCLSWTGSRGASASAPFSGHATAGLMSSSDYARLDFRHHYKAKHLHVVKFTHAHLFLPAPAIVRCENT